MNNVRLPTKREVRQLKEYVMRMNDWHSDLADYEVALWFIAVTDMYSICNYTGLTMIAVTPTGTTHLFKWSVEGKLSPLMPVYLAPYYPHWEEDTRFIPEQGDEMDDVFDLEKVQAEA